MIHLAGANIIDARIHATRSGWAVDNFLSQDPHGRPFREAAQLERIERSIEDALATGSHSSRGWRSVRCRTTAPRLSMSTRGWCSTTRPRTASP
jgi:UTP:GlnB (protein PII) uridylyltransferase